MTSIALRLIKMCVKGQGYIQYVGLKTFHSTIKQFL